AISLSSTPSETAHRPPLPAAGAAGAGGARPAAASAGRPEVEHSGRPPACPAASEGRGERGRPHRRSAPEPRRARISAPPHRRRTGGGAEIEAGGAGGHRPARPDGAARRPPGPGRRDLPPRWDRRNAVDGKPAPARRPARPVLRPSGGTPSGGPPLTVSIGPGAGRAGGSGPVTERTGPGAGAVRAAAAALPEGSPDQPGEGSSAASGESSGAASRTVTATGAGVRTASAAR